MTTPAPEGGKARRAAGYLVTGLALLLLWVAFVAPRPVLGWSPTPLALLRIPAEGILIVAALLVLRGRARRWLEVVVGVLLATLLLVRLLDAGFLTTLYRPFNPITDWRYVGSAKDLVGDSVGPFAALLAVVGAALLGVGLLVVMPLALRRLGRLVDRHRTGALRSVVGAAIVWVACLSLGVGATSDLPVASASTAGLAVHEATTVRDGLHDRAVFAEQIPVDPLRDTPPADLLTALRGKDVVIVFVESYGKVAVTQSPDVSAALSVGTKDLAGAGYSMRSAWLTSPTFGGVSWLAHSTLQSGLWVDSQQRYDQLLDAEPHGTKRLTLARAFAEAGWHTVDVIPANRRDWPEGIAFYGYDHVYDARTLGYSGPGFGYGPMPDQYTLSAFDRLELARPAQGSRRPVMAEIDLVSSHVPWAPLPRLVDWSAVGNGSVFDAQAGRATPRDVVWSSPAGVRTAYGQTIAYSIDSVVSFLRHTHDDNLVVVMLGDHQPISLVSGDNASHDVPVAVIARDPSVLERIHSWGWQTGLRPGIGAPVWPMDRFRNRFLTAYGPQGG
ncbi:phosphoglycerol transferase MdoB-like AlkP superfamily enzyme [Humibacillus xanthopallidus]|uniref:Phosphoglycerol transferase MdoB-like AlkP superfamily enzyme n=1 Tax=Humibacillus xanthopallidus TaxID=412689 RepID=A0A543PQ76_9MICO|nr:CDP-alcohol phosphatidyltransferase [Humibacillus xanthopallidus]TQN46239.1 phosphoglycerol transferase MdoB-like AlkP superfamily enzyme [Humibacillus xanthopallidus]